MYTLLKYRVSGKFIAKSGQVFDNVQRAVDFIQRNKGVDRMASIAKKESTKSIYSAPSKRQKQREKRDVSSIKVKKETSQRFKVFI